MTKSHLTLLVEDETGYRNLCRLLTAAHSHTRDNTSRTQVSLGRLSSRWRNTRRGWFASRAVLGTGSRRARSNGGRLPRGRSLLGGCSLPLGGIGFGSSCSDLIGGGTGLVTGGWRCSPSASTSPAWLPGTSMLTIGGGLLCRMRWLRSGAARRWRSPSPTGGGTRLRRLPRRRRWPPASPNIPKRWRRAGGSPSGFASI